MPFSPPRWLSNGHAMTLYAWAKPRGFPRLPAALPRYFDVTSDSRVLAHCYWQSEPRACTTLLCLHGLEGSSTAHYMRGLADKAFAEGFNVVLLNQRNCGGTESLSAGLYHSGLTGDPRAVIDELIGLDRLSSLIVAGYSLGGNLALKLAGEYGGAAPHQLFGVAAVSPTIEVAECVRSLERRSNVLYEWNFVRNLKARMRRKDACWPGRFPMDRLSSVRTVREFDDTFTAPHFGFRDAGHYYHHASAMRVVGHIAVPALILAAKDDPFVPWEPFVDSQVADNPHIEVELTEHGGHCAYLSRNGGGGDGYWAEWRVIEFAKALRGAASRMPDQSPVLRA